MAQITAAQLLNLAKQLKGKQGAQQEAQQLEQLAQSGLSEEQQAQIHSVMQDKAKLAAVLNSPQAKALMQKLGGKPIDNEQ